MEINRQQISNFGESKLLFGIQTASAFLVWVVSAFWLYRQAFRIWPYWVREGNLGLLPALTSCVFALGVGMLFACIALLLVGMLVERPGVAMRNAFVLGLPEKLDM